MSVHKSGDDPLSLQIHNSFAGTVLNGHVFLTADPDDTAILYDHGIRKRQPFIGCEDLSVGKDGYI